MSLIDIVDLSSDDECGHLNVKAVKLEPGIVAGRIQQKENKVQLVKRHKSQTQCGRQESEENRGSNALSTGKIWDQGQSPVDDTSLLSTSPTCPAPLCRQFWKAGNYDDGLGSKVSLQNGKNYLHVHPLFLHSNATSHKWVFGAVAELLDNAVDEIQNGATFVLVDKTTNPKDGGPALLIQDDGGGMDPVAMRHCMSFGFSDKKSKSAIGQYGNGFKTSTMRLGADAIVFSRHLNNRTMTQSIGLLAYTFLTQTGHDRIVVPMVDYEFNASTGALDILHGKEHFMPNLSMLLQWSPFSTEAELLKQFNDIGAHGTKVIVYNLWFNDDGDVELDFESDPEDIRVSGETKKIGTIPGWKTVNEQHIANQFHYSLRVYLSILYLRVPERFNIILRGRVVEHHNIAHDLKFPEFILYRPQSGGCVEGQVITSIGFLKEAPLVGFHGFNVYHKNRLILPFWQVLSSQNSRGRGVVGVLEANFIEPTHNKQDFERTSLFQKLETRLKEMTFEYWDYHCGLIGYHSNKIPRAPVTPQVSSHCMPHSSKQLDMSKINSPAISGLEAALGRAEQSISKSQSISELGFRVKRKEHGDIIEVEKAKRQAVEVVNVTDSGHCQDIQALDAAGSQLKDQETLNLLQANKKLHAECLEYEKREEELKLKVTQLKIEIEEVQHEYDRMLGELKSLSTLKDEKNVHITQGDYDGTAVIISWVTTDEPGNTKVQYGRSKEKYDFTAEGTVTNYTFYNYKSGYIHHCLVDGLEYNKKYYYKIGVGESSREFWFQTPPDIDPDASYTFGIIGDLGQTYNSLSTLEHYMQSGGQTVLYVIGDLSYADRYEYNNVGIRWDSWGRFIERSSAYQPWIWSAGNHEIEYMPRMGEVLPFKSYLHRFMTPHIASNSSSPLWYAVRRASTHIIVLSSYSPFVKSTPQWKWLHEELKRVDRLKTPWLIVLMHVPIYNSNQGHYMEGESMRAVFESWFVCSKVDFIFAGHVHAYERSYRISNIHYNVSSGDRYPVTDSSAPVYITVGDGGNQEGLAGRFWDPQPGYSAFREAGYGHSTLEIRNRTHAFYHWNRNDDGKKAQTDSVVFYNQYWASNLQRRRFRKSHCKL